MLCLPLKELCHDTSQADLVELRLDLLSLHDLKLFKKSLRVPTIVTLKEQNLEPLFLEPDYVDVPCAFPVAFTQTIAHRFPKIKRIISYHNFQQTPHALEAILRQMKQHEGDLYKIACMANSTNDALRLLLFAREHAPLLGMCMGEKGSISRILAPLFGIPWVFAPLTAEQKTAEGQLTIQELKTIYGIHQLSPETSIYGLIGSPVTQSVGHLLHNHVMQEAHMQSIYVKMDVQKTELEEFFALAKKIRIKGLSVTMPLKEAVMPFLDTMDAKARAIGAVNTIVFEGDTMHGSNTDADGALDAIEAKMRVRDKHIVILGTGGAAKAIAYEAVQRGARVTLLNRTELRAKVVDYDILINATASLLPIGAAAIRPHTLVMDVHTLPQMTPFLEAAAAKGCTLIFGYEMFINQAVQQYVHWLGPLSELMHSQKRKNVCECVR